MVIKISLFVIFMVIATISIWFLLSPAVKHEKTPLNEDVVSSPSGLTYQGMFLRYEAWKTYPEYNIGFGVIGILSFAGSVISCRSIYKEHGDKNEVS